MKIVVLGGGLAGCTSAYLLKQQGHDVVVFEEKEEIGGVCQTNDFGGIFHEFGPHLLYAEGKIKKFFEKHLINREFKVFPKASVSGRIDEFYDFPLSLETVTHLPDEIRYKALDELYKLNFDSPDHSNFESYMISRMGKTLYDLFAKTYNKKQWGMPAASLDANWAKFRPFEISQRSKSRFGDKWQGHPGTYRTFFENITKGIEIKKAHVEKIVIDRKRANGIQFAENGKTEIMEADFVVSTLPLDKMISSKKSLAYRNTLKVFALLDTPEVLPTMWLTFPNHNDFLRVFEYKKQSQQKHKNTLLSFSFQYFDDEDIEKQSMDEVMRFLDANISSEVIDSKMEAWDKTYPLPTLENEKAFSFLLQESSVIDNFVTVGRQGLFAYISMDTCVGQCMSVVDNLEKFISGSQDERMQVYASMRRVMS